MSDNDPAAGRPVQRQEDACRAASLPGPAGSSGSFPLTDSQQEILLEARLGAEASCAFNQLHVLPLKGLLSLHALERALARLVQRHDALRLSADVDGQSQWLAGSVPVVLPHQDLSGLDSGARDAAWEAMLGEEAGTPVDAQAPMLWRARVVTLGADEHRLIFNAHHLVFDGRSPDLLFGEWGSAYAAERLAREAGSEPPVAQAPSGVSDAPGGTRPPVRSMTDVVRAQHTPDYQAAAARDLAWWQQAYRPGIPAWDLPADRPRKPWKTYACGTETLTLTSTQVQALRALAHARGCSLFTLLLTAFQALMSRLSGAGEWVLGVPVRSPSLGTDDPVIGHAIETLPLRCTVDLEQPFSALLDRVGPSLQEALNHRHATFGSIVRALAPPRDPSRTPLVDVLFNVTRTQQPADFGPDLTAGRFLTPKRYANFDLHMTGSDTGTELHFECHHNLHLFEGRTVRRWLALYAAMLERAVTRPDAATVELLAPTPADQAWLQAANQTASPYPAQTRIEQLFGQRVRAAPDTPALTVGARRWSYREIDDRSDALALALQGAGVGRGDRVGLCCSRDEHLLISLLGVLKTGAAYVPLDPDYPAARLAHMVADAAMVCVLATAEHAHHPGLAGARVRRLEAGSEAGQAGRAPVPAGATSGDPAYVIYTSGSTGAPKGVAVPHRAVVNFLHSMARQPGLAAGERLLAVTTLSFDIAVLELMLPLVVGAHIVLATRAQASDGRALRELLDTSQADVLQATPSSWRLLIEAGWAARPGFRALVGGEPLPADLAEALLARGVELWNLYGPTETTVWSTAGRVEDPTSGITIGRPIANTQIHVLDDHRRPCPVGVAGELWIGGAGVALGYWNRPELTAERFVADPFSPGGRLYRTGDLGRWRDDGQLIHLGRLDRQVKVRGHRIELGEIEAVLARHPGVQRAVVDARAAGADARLVAYLVPAGAWPGAQPLRAWLKEQLPDYMVPQQWVPLDDVPLLPNGKVDRSALPEPPTALDAEAPAEPGVRSPAQQTVAEIWCELLELRHVELQDNFFDLGGHSLLAMRAALQIEQRLGFSISIRRLLTETLEQIAQPPSGEPHDADPPRPAPPSSGLIRRLGSMLGLSKGRP